MGDNVLIVNPEKEVLPNEPVQMDEDIYVVNGADSVNIKLSFEGIMQHGPVGIDLVFLIDNSRSMNDTDPEKNRFRALKDMADNFRNSRQNLDLISIKLFADNEVETKLIRGRWSDAFAIADGLLDEAGGGNTPFDIGMANANELLRVSTRNYKMVILLSDAIVSILDSTAIIAEHIPNAISYNIFYSTILLTPAETQLNDALLCMIARDTERVLVEEEEHPPTYYFCINNDISIERVLNAYMGLFSELMDRQTPRNVKLVEKIDRRLLVDLDPEKKPSFFPGENTDMISYNSDLTQSIENFQNSGVFEIELDELVGPLVLDFYVKLNYDVLSSNDFQNRYILTGANDCRQDNHSFIQYDYPTDDGSFATRTGSCYSQYEGIVPFIPQKRIKWLLGARITKSAMNEGTQVKINVQNLSLNNLEWAWIKENLSAQLDYTSLEDDFEFYPFKKIITYLMGNAILPSSMFQLLTNANKELSAYFTEFDSIVPGMIDQLKLEYPVLKKGQFRLVKDLQARKNKHLTLNLKNIAYLPVPMDEVMHFENYDCPEVGSFSIGEFKEGPNIVRSEIFPNPTKYYSGTYQNIPDLKIGTCFEYETIEEFYKILYKLDQSVSDDLFSTSSIRGLGSAAKQRMKLILRKMQSMLDSEDISIELAPYTNFSKPQPNPSIPEFFKALKVKVNVHNLGNIAAESEVNAMTICFPGIEEKRKVKWIEPFICTNSKSTGLIESKSMKEIGFNYSKIFQFTGSLNDLTRPYTNPEVNNITQGVLVNIAKVKPVSNEKIISNNWGAEIIKFEKPTR